MFEPDVMASRTGNPRLGGMWKRPAPSSLAARLTSLTAIVAALVAAPAALALEITTDTVWRQADSPIHIADWVQVNAGATLSIEPGVQVRFHTLGSSLQGNIHVTTGGQLLAQGAPGQPVLFTHDEGSTRTWGWSYLLFDPGSKGALEHCQIEYADGWGGPVVRVQSSDVAVRDCVIRDNASDALQISGVHVTPIIERVQFLNNTGWAITQDSPNMSPTYSDLTASGNGRDAILIQYGGTITGDATWHDAGLPYALYGWYDVAQGGSLTIEPGVTVRFGPLGSALQGNIEVKSGGRIWAEGTESKRIRLTSDKATPAAGDWAYVMLENGAHGSFSQCDFEYGGQWNQGQLSIQSSNVTVTDCAFLHSFSEGICIDGQSLTPTVHNVQITTCGQYGIQILGTAAAPVLDGVAIRGAADAAIFQSGIDMAPDYRAITLEGNGADAVFIDGGLFGVIRRDVTLRQSVGAYHIHGWCSVDNGATLTVEPGVAVKFVEMGTALQANIIVKPGATLRAVGTAGDGISFTHLDGPDAPYPWYSLKIENGAAGIFEHCYFERGGDAYRGLLWSASSDLTVRNCRFHNAVGSAIYLEGAGLMPTITDTSATSGSAWVVAQSTCDMSPTYRSLSGQYNAEGNAIYIPGWSVSITRPVTWPNCGLPIVYEG